MSTIVGSGAHRFEANVVAGPFGSSLKLDGVDVPELVEFSISHAADSMPRLEIRTHAIGKCAGFVDAITWLGTGWVLMLEDRPVGVHFDREAAFAVAKAMSDPRVRVVDVPFEITR